MGSAVVLGEEGRGERCTVKSLWRSFLCLEDFGLRAGYRVRLQLAIGCVCVTYIVV